MEKREVIMKHYKNPINYKKDVNDSYVVANTNNESCIDNLNIYVKLNGDVIEDIAFDGEACAISISSTSVMIDNLVGMNIIDANKYILEFEKMINGEEFDANILKDGIIYNDIDKNSSRKMCALLPYIGIKKIVINK